MPKILITGGAGYIGSHVNKELHLKSYKTIVLDNLSTGHYKFTKWGRFAIGNINNKDLLNTLFKTYNIDTVIHLAASAYVEESINDPSKYYNNNVGNTISLLDSMVENNVKNIIFSSSCAVYGIPNELPISEDTPCNPISPYGRTKKIIEDILEDYSNAYGLNYISLRYFNAAGADFAGEIGEKHDPETHLIPLVLEAAKDPTKTVKINGTDYNTYDGSCVREYVHVVDLANAHVKAIEYLRRNQSNNIFNLGGYCISVRDIIKTCARHTKSYIKTIETERRPGDPPYLSTLSGKTIQKLNWFPRYSNITDIIESAWAWHNRR
ncbi:MAG: UDP-glucose 4-epimerase GalE [archaeon]